MSPPPFTTALDTGDKTKTLDILAGAEARVGKLRLLGRYHGPARPIHTDYVMTDTSLGRGHQGTVLLATRKDFPAHKVAVKRFFLGCLSDRKISTLVSEVQVHLCMDHPHIARLIDVYESEERLDLVMECMEGGELFERVRSQRQHSEFAASAITRQVLLALNYMHSHGVVHRDLKLENILFASKDTDDLKLIDFGFSKFRDRCQKMKTDCGTLSYIAPEVFSHNYTSQCDMWSLGVIVFILLSGKMPFYGPDFKQIQQIKAGSFKMRTDVWSRLSSQAGDFVRSLLEVDPNVRMTSRKAMAHAWMERHVSSPVHLKLHPSTVQALCDSLVASKLQVCCRCIVAGMLPHEDQASVVRIFQAFDVDNEGRLSLSNLQHAMRMFQVPEEEILQVFHVLSRGKDEILYSDFVAALLGTDIPWHDDLLRIAFRKFDPKDSGQIPLSELWNALGEEEICAVGRPEGKQPQPTDTLFFSDFADYVRGGSSTSQAQDRTEVDALELQPSRSSITLNHRQQKPDKLRASVRGLTMDLPVLLPRVGGADAAHCRRKEITGSSDDRTVSGVGRARTSFLQRRQAHLCCVAM